MENKAKSSRGVSFLKVLNGDFSKQLPIPPSFTKNFKGEIPHFLIIEVAGTRKCWKVDVEEDNNGGLCFTDGWDGFVEALTLEVGNFLVFAYKGQLILEVTVYDKDGSEKPAVGQASEYEARKVFEDSELQPKTSKTHHAEEASTLSTRTRLGKLLASQKDGTKRKRTEVSVTEEGVSFSVEWRETKTSCYYLAIPRAVVFEKHLSSKEGVVLKDQEGKSWPIELATRLDGRVDFTRGWREFMNAKQFSVGDKLTFEFLSDNQILVHIARTSQVDHRCRSQKLCRNETTESLNNTSQPAEPATNSTDAKKASEASESTERVCSEFIRSSFSATWKETTKGTYLYVPAKIAKEQNLRNKKTVVLSDEEGTEWHLTVKTRQNGHVTLTEGWPEFRRRNKIATGDTLNFKFVSDCKMKVNITRASQGHRGIEWVAVKREIEID